MNWLYYVAEANLYLGVFYLAYCVFLVKETYYQLNRGYLVISCVVAFVIPLIQLGFLKPVEYVVQNTANTTAITTAPTWPGIVLYLYIIGVLFFAAQFIVKLYQLKKIIKANPVNVEDNYKLVSLEDHDTAFSFFGYLFMGKQVNQVALITRHELVHIRQKHSVDVVFMELVQIISWFNPVIYLIQNSLKTVHEYVADEQTALSDTDTIAYATYLLNNAYGISGPTVTHSFFNYNLLKKRIIMLHQKRSGSLARLKYLIAVPLCAGLLCESTIGFSKTYGFISIGRNTAAIMADTLHKKVPPPPPLPPAVPKKSKKIIDVVLTPPPPPAKTKGKHLRRNLPPPPAPPLAKPTSEVRIDEPVSVPPAKKVSGTEIRIEDVSAPLPPSPEKGKVKFPPPIITKDKPAKKLRDIKFPPPVVIEDKPAKKVSDVKFPPPIITKDKPTKS